MSKCIGRKKQKLRRKKKCKKIVNGEVEVE